MSTAPLRIVFAGTPDFAAAHLKALIDSKHQLIAVYTQPDRRAGRGKKVTASPVKQLALDAGIEVRQPHTLRDEIVQRELGELAADVLVVVAYGLILPQEVLALPAAGCLNVHASLLPRWRGAAPVQRAVEAGDATTGITIMQMDAGLDTGDMLATVSCNVDAHSSASLLDHLAQIGPPLLLQVLDDLASYQARAQRQDDAQACYADKISKSEAAVDWREDALVLERRVRAFNPFPVCYAGLDGERVRIWEATAQAPADSAGAAPGTITAADEDGIVVQCGSGSLRIRNLQLPGGRVLDAGEVLNARRESFTPGTRFDEPEGPGAPPDTGA